MQPGVLPAWDLHVDMTANVTSSAGEPLQISFVHVRSLVTLLTMNESRLCEAVKLLSEFLKVHKNSWLTEHMSKHVWLQ